MTLGLEPRKLHAIIIIQRENTARGKGVVSLEGKSGRDGRNPNSHPTTATDRDDREWSTLTQIPKIGAAASAAAAVCLIIVCRLSVVRPLSVPPGSFRASHRME